MTHELQHPLIQRSYRRQYKSLLDELRVGKGARVLDIGSGLGFLKALVQARGATYIGIEPDAASIESAKALYGSEGFVLGFFPEAAPAQRFDVALVLSCVDEVPDKAGFLRGLKAHLEPGTGVGYIAVRNRAFFVNRFKTEATMAGRSQRARIKDLSAPEWEALIEASGLRVSEQGKFWRPWLTGFSFTGLKNVAYRLISLVGPRRGSYMLYYKITAP